MLLNNSTNLRSEAVIQVKAVAEVMTHKAAVVASITKPQGTSVVTSIDPITRDEEIILSAFNKAFAAEPKLFVSLWDSGSLNYSQARAVTKQLGLMGHWIQEEAF